MTAKSSLLKLLYWTAQRAASSYVAGARLEDALRVCRALRTRSVAATICPWDAVGTAPREVFRSYHEALQGIAASGLDCYLSVKLPSLKYDSGMLRELLDAARPRGIRIHLDSLGPETVDPTLTAAERLAGEYDNLGFTLPGRWRRSLLDARRVAAAGMPVRLVKGQFEDAASAETDPARGFLELARTLCGTARLAAVASHDAALAKECLALLRQAQTPCELEQLYGLPSVAAKAGAPVRVYVPYDYGYLPYALSQIKKKPKILWWLVRDAVRSYAAS